MGPVTESFFLKKISLDFQKYFYVQLLNVHIPLPRFPLQKIHIKKIVKKAKMNI